MWLDGVNRADRNSRNQLHGGIARECENIAAHTSSKDKGRVCLACRVASFLQIKHERPELLDMFFLPLCVNCGHRALENPNLPRGCKCVGWFCPNCDVRTMEDALVKANAAFEMRRSCKGVCCPCGKEVDKDDGKMKVVRQCTGCSGLVKGRWGRVEEEGIMDLVRKIRDRGGV